MSSRPLEFFKFCIVGCICTAIDAIVFYATHNFIGYQAALVLGFLTSISVNYILNIYWSFKRKPSLESVIAVIGANCFNTFVVRMALMWLFINHVNLPEGIAFIPTLLISVLSNFILVRFAINHFSKA